MSNKVKEPKTINVGVIYNAFDPSVIQKDVVRYRKGKTLNSYLRGLPTHCEWKVGLNGMPVDTKVDGKRKLQPNDQITLVVVPRGGGGTKNILRMVAMVAIAVVAWYAAPFVLAAMGTVTATALAIGAVAGALTLVGGFLVNALLGPKIPKIKSNDDGDSYGYDGAKNTAKEGVPIPVIYGNYRVAGNYIDIYTENVGDDQYLYGRTVISDGTIENVTEPEINEQPISAYTNLEWGFTKGLDTDTVNPYFGKSIAQINRAVKLTSAYTTHTTTAPVDQIQLNVQFPRGLVHITKKKGTKQNRACTITAEYKSTSSSTWLPFGEVQWLPVSPVTAVSPTTTKLKVVVIPTISGGGRIGVPYNYTVEYKTAASSTWTTFVQDSGITSAATYTTNNGLVNWGIRNSGLTQFTALANEKTYEIPVTSGAYQVRVVGGTVASFSYSSNVTGTATKTFTDNRVKTIRKTIQSQVLPFDTYDIRIRKTSAEGDNEYDLDEIWLSDVGEIETLGVPIRNISNAWYKVKMTDQLSGIPNISWQVQGVKVNQYDINGNVIATAWSDNPAWIVLDMLIGPQRGNPGIYNIDFPMFVEWANFCEDENFKFNGVFDSLTSLWDACQDVLKVGHATFSRIGTKLSVAIDRAVTPSMLFGPGNIFKDSFKIGWISLQDRANEFEVSYFDKDDRNKQKTIRIVDPDAEAKGLPVRAVSYTLFGIDNFDQAQREVWYQLYNNRYLRRSITFDAPVESIGLSIGDVALVQHDMMNWGTSGRIAAGSTNSIIKLDKNVLMESGSDYAMLCIHNSVVLSTGTLHSNNISTKTVVIKLLSNGTFDPTKAKRLVIASPFQDVEINSIHFLPYDITNGYQCQIVTADEVSLSAAGSVTIYETDSIEERDVIFNSAETNTVTVTSPFTLAPAQYTNYMFGVKQIVKKPYRLRAMSGEGFDRRTLTFVEYNSAIYNDPEHIVPQPPTTLPSWPTHVRELIYSYSVRATDGTTAVTGILSWKSDHIHNYAGVDIYIKLNGSDYNFFKTVQDVSEAQLDFNIGDDVSIKVVAFNNNLIRANFNTAPYIDQVLQTGPAQLDPPENLNLTQISFLALGIVEASWDPPSAHADDTALVYRVQRQIADGVWDEYAVTSEHILRVGDLPSGYISIRVRTEKGQSYSTWIENEIHITTIPGQTIEPGATVGAPNGTHVGDLYAEDIVNAIADITAAITPDLTPPGTVTGLALSSTLLVDTDGSQIVTLTATWDASIATDILGYDIAIKEGAGSFIEFTTGATSYSWKVGANIAFTAKVRAYDTSGNRGAYSSTVSHTTLKDTTPPAIATSLTATAAFATIFLSWTNPSDVDLKQTEIWENTTNSSGTATKIATVNAQPSAAGAFTRSGLATGVTRYYWVKSIDSSGNASAFSSVASATTAYITIGDVSAGVAPISIVSSLPSTGNYEGRIVYLSTDDKLYRWTDTSTTGTTFWTAAVDGADITASSITGNKIVAGTIQAAHIATSTLTAEKFAVGTMSENLIQNGNAEDGINGWDIIDGTMSGITFSVDTSIKQSGKQGFRINKTSTSNAVGFGCKRIPVIPGKSYRVKGSFIADITTGTGFFFRVLYQGTTPTADYVTGATSSGYTDLISASSLTTSWQTFEFNWTCPASTYWATVSVYSWGTGPTALVFDEIQMQEQITSAIIADGAITAAKIVAGTITSDRIQAGTITGDRFNTGTSLPGTITVGSTGVSIGTIQTQADDPAARVNAMTTAITPGKILISGSTFLSDWRNGSDNTKIEGGSIATNSITTNKIKIGARGVTTVDLEFQSNSPIANQASWTSGYILYIDDSGSQAATLVSAGNTTTWTSGVGFYIYWVKGASTLSVSTNYAVALGTGDNVLLASYTGGPNLVAHYGGTIIDGSKIVTGSITASQIAAGTIVASNIAAGTITSTLLASGTIITSSAQIANGIIINAKIGNLEVDSAKIANLTVGTTKITANAITNHDEFGYDYGGYTFSSGGGYRLLTDGSVTVEVAPFVPDDSGAIVVVQGYVRIHAPAGQADLITLKCVRTNDSAVIGLEPSSVICDHFSGGNMSAIFVDTAPIQNATNTYRFYAKDITVAWFLYDTAFVAQVFSK